MYCWLFGYKRNYCSFCFKIVLLIYSYKFIGFYGGSKFVHSCDSDRCYPWVTVDLKATTIKVIPRSSKAPTSRSEVLLPDGDNRHVQECNIVLFWSWYLLCYCWFGNGESFMCHTCFFSQISKFKAITRIYAKINIV